MAVEQYEDDFGRKRFRVRVAINSKKDKTIRFRKVISDIESLKKAETIYKRLKELAWSRIALKEVEVMQWGRLIDSWELELRAGRGAKRGVNAQSAEDYIAILRIYTKEWLKLPADQISKSAVKAILEFVNDTISHSRMKRLKTAIDGIFTWAIDTGVVTSMHSSPATGISFNKRVEEKKPEILSLSEIRRFLVVAEETNNKWYPIWVMALMTGMRSGELYALEWQDVDFENKRINVHKSYNKRIRKVGPTKAGYWREVPISQALELFLKRIKGSCNGRASVLPRFSDWEKGYGAAVLRAFLVGHGLPSIRFHALRACFATQLIREGIAPAIVMKICGWKDLKTMQRYIRLAGIEIEGATEGLRVIPEEKVMNRVVDLFSPKV